MIGLSAYNDWDPYRYDPIPGGIGTFDHEYITLSEHVFDFAFQ